MESTSSSLKKSHKESEIDELTPEAVNNQRKKEFLELNSSKFKIKFMESELHKTLNDRLKELLMANKDLHDLKFIKPVVTCKLEFRPQASIKSRESLINILRTIMDYNNKDLNQVEIRKIVAENGFAQIRKNWTSRLPEYALKYIRKCFSNDTKYGLNKYAVTSSMTLSQFHKTVKNAYNYDGGITYKAIITINDKKININGVDFKWRDGGNNKSVRQVAIAMKKLISALDNKPVMKKAIKGPRRRVKKNNFDAKEIVQAPEQAPMV